MAPTGDQCGEGAVWHAAHSAVYWTDINRFLIHRFTLADQCVRTWFFDEPVTALTLPIAMMCWRLSLGSGVILWEPAPDVRHEPIFRLEGWPAVRLNDGRADPRGSLWVGSMRNNVNPDGSSREAGGKDGILYRLDPDAARDCSSARYWHLEHAGWSPDRRRFYFGDSLANTIWSYDYDRAAPARSHNEVDFFTGFRAGTCRMARPWMPRAICGIAATTADALFVWRRMERLIA